MSHAAHCLKGAAFSWQSIDHSPKERYSIQVLIIEAIMFAIIRTGGKQYRVQEGQMLRVEKLPTESGEVVFPEVLLIGGDRTKVGDPLIKNAQVKATVLGLTRAKKIVVRKYKRKVRYRRKIGHRQTYSKVKIEKIITSA